ncbi:peroxidase 27-like protein [Tanacetum coccineum]
MAIQKQLIVSPVLLIALVFENSPWKGCDGSVTAKLLLQNNQAEMMEAELTAKRLEMLSSREGILLVFSHCPVMVNGCTSLRAKGLPDRSKGDSTRLCPRKRGLFQSDAALLNDKQTSAYVKLQSKSFGYTFFNDFSKSMVKMGKIGVLTGNAGEIRRTFEFCGGEEDEKELVEMGEVGEGPFGEGKGEDFFEDDMRIMKRKEKFRREDLNICIAVAGVDRDRDAEKEET